MSCASSPFTELATLFVPLFRSETLLAPSVLLVLSRFLRTVPICPLALASTSLTSVISVMVRRCSASWDSGLVLKLLSSRPETDGSVTRPGCTVTSKLGTVKSCASSTSLSWAFAATCGGARMAPHCTDALPCSDWASTPLVRAASWPAKAVITLLAGVSSSTVEATTVNGTPTSAVRVRRSPETS